MTLAAAGLLSCTGTGQSAFDPASVADASGEVTRVEPLSWWTGMQTPLQLLVNGAGIAAYDVRIEGGQGALSLFPFPLLCYFGSAWSL